MFVVVNVHRLRVNEWLQRVVGVRQRRQRERPARCGGGRGGICLGNCAGQSRERGAGERGGFNGLASCHHNFVWFGSNYLKLDTQQSKKFKLRRLLSRSAFPRGLWRRL